MAAMAMKAYLGNIMWRNGLAAQSIS